MKHAISRPQRLFINYRKDDTGSAAASLVEYLEREFADDQIFIDDGIGAGDDWPERLQHELEECTLFLAFLGRRWLEMPDEKTGLPRIDDPKDWVRREIERALQRSKTDDLLVVPILVDDATLPTPDELPDAVKGLANKQSRPLRPLAKRDLATDRQEISALLTKRGFVVRADPVVPDPVHSKGAWLAGSVAAMAGVIAWIAYASGMFNVATGSSEPQPTPFAWSAEGEDSYGKWADASIDGLPLRMRWMEPATFLMGSPPDEAGRDVDENQRSVQIASGYWIADVETTQGMWRAVMRDAEDRFRFQGAQLPAESVSWDDVQRFLREANRRFPGIDLRLPLESEWEYACRAGTTTPFAFGVTATADQVNYDGTHPYGDGPKGKRRDEPVEVKGLPANRWGLHEMHGNVWEWCADRGEGSSRILRGGSWINNGASCRSASRDVRATNRRSGDVGFRVVRSADKEGVQGE